jgi:hypothetical protein
MSKGFHVPPECQGQIVEVAYMCAGPQMVRRIHDRSDGRTSYEVADVGPDDSSWYETFEACNGAPPLTDWAPIDEACLARLIEDWS